MLMISLGTLASALGVVVTTRDHTIFDASQVGSRPPCGSALPDKQGMRICLLLWPAICTCTHLTLTSTIIYGLLKYRQGLTASTNIVDRLI